MQPGAVARVPGVFAQDEEAPQATPQPTIQPAEGAVQLEFWDMNWGSSLFMSRMQDNITEFNQEHPDIHVSFTQLAWGDYTQKLLSAVQAGNPPDIGGGDSGIPFNMAAQGEALDISDLFAEWEADGTFDDMAPWAYEKWNFQGMNPGITWQHDSRGIYYRKDLLEEAGIDVPTTWEEWRAAMEALHNPAVRGSGAKSTPSPPSRFSPTCVGMRPTTRSWWSLTTPPTTLMPRSRFPP